MANNTLKGGIYGCVSAISYGMNPLCALSLYEDGMNSSTVLFYRFFIGSLLLGALMLFQRKSFALTCRETVVLSLLGVLFAASSLTYFVSFHYMPAGVAATLVFAYPVFVAVLMALFFGERLKAPSLLAIALTLGGISLLYKGDGGQPIAVWGIVLVLVSALTYALYIIVVNQSGIVMSSVKLTFFAMVVCLACMVLFSLVAPSASIAMLHTPRQWFFAVLLALVPGVVSLVFMAMAIRCIGSTPTAIMGALEPVTAIVFGVALFGEMLTPRLGVGIVLILVSVILIILDRKISQALGHMHILRRGRKIVKRWIWR